LGVAFGGFGNGFGNVVKSSDQVCTKEFTFLSSFYIIVGEWLSKVPRLYPPCPLVGVGVLVVEGDKILLVKREKDPGKGRWSIPGGLLELGELLRDGAKRETKEETGIDVDIIALLDVIDNIVRDEEGKVSYHYVLIDFLGHRAGGDLHPGTDAKEARWASIQELDILTTTMTLRRLVEKAKLLKE
jgi:8-oxo-dGTP diphosphatase